jgi:hypothetical protein
MRWWLALVPEPAADAFATAPVCGERGEPQGWLAAWPRPAKPLRGALRVDGRIIDRRGEAAWISLVLAPAGVRLTFDDLAVQQARRDVLARRPADAVSTLLRDDSHFEGAITVMRGPDARARLRDDPFARVFPARLLSVADGLLGRVAPPVGPVIERYGSANPWPLDRWAG